MGKSFLSWFLLACAAVVAYTAVSDYLNSIVTDNFSTPTVVEVNKKAKEVGADYQLGIDDIAEKAVLTGQ